MRPPDATPHQIPDSGASQFSAQSSALTVLIASSVILFLDQMTKIVAARELGRAAERHRVEVIGSWAGWEYVENTGAAFGILAGSPLLTTVLATMVALAFVYFLRTMIRDSRVVQVALGAILAGALGNNIDRFRLGYVVDFIAIGPWPRFNIADSAVTLGVTAVAWWILTHEPEAQTP